MTDGQVTVLIAAITWIFAAGGVLMWARMSIEGVKKEATENKAVAARDLETLRVNLYRDINGVGAAGRRNEDDAARRYHNLSMALLIAAPQGKESEVSKLLREGT